MQLLPEALEAHLDASLASAYLLSGDEPLLMQESADRIRAAARARGFTERQVHHADGRQFDWNALLAEAGARSLFAERKILEIRLATAKPGEQGSKALVELCRLAGDELLLLVIAPKLDRSAQGSVWVKALAQTGAQLQIWPVDRAGLPQWITTRLRHAGLAVSRPAAELLAERVEGNLLAAAQEIEKLRLLAPAGELDADAISTAVADSARFNIFKLADQALAGNTQAACRSLRGLHAEGVEPAVVLWALARDALIIARLHGAGRAQQEQIFRDARVWDSRKDLLRDIARRIRPAQINLLLRQLAGVDRAIKGVRDASPWDELLDILLSLCGRNAIHPANLRLGLEQGRRGAQA
ncbi:MAG: DNA polymerase III subunit delta [Porticoccaceae bacterium]